MIVPLDRYIDIWQSLTVLVVGDVMLDSYLQGTTDRLCQEAPVPVVAITEQQDFPGGAANVAANVSRLGAKTWLLSVIGQDETGERLRSALCRHQVATPYLFSSSLRSTLSKQRVVGNHQVLIRFDQGSTHSLAEDFEQQIIQQLSELFPGCDAVIVSDYGYGVITSGIIQTLETLQRRYKKTLVIDSKNLALYQNVNASAVKPNYAETLKLLSLPPDDRDRIQQLTPYTQMLLDLTGADRVAVTLDRDGVLMLERDQPYFHLPTRPAPTHHTSGAGDTFISALTLALAAQAPTPTAAQIATAATAISVSQPGTTVCTVEALRQQVEERKMSMGNGLMGEKIY
jgi:D-beta-D-heptose 7-phosphate kinase/D-beta-D-heptose 1-phosphate adenosyltransferase